MISSTNTPFEELSYVKDDRRRPVSKALFETWGVRLARRSKDEISHLVNKRRTVVSGFVKLMKNNWEFERAITYSTGTPTRVRERFQAVDELISGCL